MTTTLSFRNETAEQNREGRFELARDATLRLRAAGDALHLRSAGGAILVTREGDPEDHLLQAGDEVRISGPGLVVAWALDAARLVVSREEALASRAHAA